MKHVVHVDNPGFLYREKLHVIIIIVLAVLTTSPSIFVQDSDSDICSANLIINPSDGFRPLEWSSFAITRTIFGQSLFFDRVMNILLYASACAFVWWCVTVCFRSKPLALFTGVLFAVHPVHASAAGSLAARGDILGAVLFLAAWGLYLSGRNPKSGMSIVTWRLTASAGLFFLALLANPAVAVFPLLIAASNYIRRTESLNLLWKRTWWHYLPFLTAIILALCIRLIMTGSLTWPPPIENPFSAATVGERLGTSLGVTGRYLHILVNPLRLSDYKGYNDIALVNIFSLPGLLVAGFAIGFAALAILAGRKFPVLGFGIFFALVTTVFNLNIFYTAAETMSDRFLFLAVLGISLPIGALVAHCAEKRPRFAAISGASALVLFWGILGVTYCISACVV